MSDWQIESEAPSSAQPKAPSDSGWHVESEKPAAPKQKWGQKFDANVDKPKDFGAYDRFSYGLAEGVEGAAQLGAHVVDAISGTPEKYHVLSHVIDKDIGKMQSEYDEKRAAAGQSGIDWANIAGTVANPLNYIGPGEASIARTGVNALARTARPAVNALASMARVGGEGARIAAIQPVVGGDFGVEKAKQIALGIPAALLTHGVVKLTGAALAPVVAPLWRFAKSVFGDAAGATHRAAVGEIMRRLNQDATAGGPTAQDMLDILHAAPGKPLTLADLGGENVRSLTGKLARTPGESRQTVTKALTDRDIDSAVRMSSDVEKHIASGSSHDAASTLMESRAKAAAPLYESAFKANQNIQSQAIDRLLRTPAGSSALKAARIKMQNDLSLMARPDPELAEQIKESGQNLKGGVSSGLKLRTLDYVKRALGDMIGASKRAGLDDDVRILTARKNELVKALDEADVTAKAGPNSTKPEGGLYAQARKAYSGPSQSLDALKAGEKIFSATPEEIAENFSKLDQNDKEFFRLGQAAAIRKEITSAGPGRFAKRLDVAGDLNYRRAQLRATFDSDEAFSRFMNAIDAEGRMFGTKAEVLGNSKTAARSAEDTDPSHSAMMNAGQAAWSASHGNWLGAMSAARRAISDAMSTRDPAVNAEMARLLTHHMHGPSSGMNLLRQFSAVAPRTGNSLRAATPRSAFVVPLLPQPVNSGSNQ